MEPTKDMLMKPPFLYAKELDLGVIGINLNHVVSINKGSIKTSGEEVTMIKLSTGKELVIRLSFEEFQNSIENL